MISPETQFICILVVVAAISTFWLFRKFKEDRRIKKSRQERFHKRFQYIAGGLNQEEIFEIVGKK